MLLHEISTLGALRSGQTYKKLKEQTKNVCKFKSLQVIAFLLITTNRRKIEPQESSSEQIKIHSVKTVAGFCRTSQSSRAPALSQNEQLCDLLILHHMQLVRSVTTANLITLGRIHLKPRV